MASKQRRLAELAAPLDRCSIGRQLACVQSEMASLQQRYPGLAGESHRADPAVSQLSLEERFPGLEWSAAEDSPEASLAPRSEGLEAVLAKLPAFTNSTRPRSARQRSATPRFCSGSEEPRVVYHCSRPLSSSGDLTPRGFLGESRPAAAGGWAPARSGSRRSLGQHPPGYRGLSQNASSPAFSMGARLTLSRDVDPLLPDDTPGPGAYECERFTRLTRAEG